MIESFRRTWIIGFILLTILLHILSCGGGSARFVKNPNYDTSKLEKIAVFPFTGSDDLGVHFANMLGLDLVGAGFTVVERSEIARILEEQGLQQSDLMDKGEIIDTGRLLGVDAILLGSIMDAESGALYIRLIDVQTGELIGGMSFEAGEQLATFKDVESAARAIAKKILSSIKS